MDPSRSTKKADMFLNKEKKRRVSCQNPGPIFQVQWFLCFIFNVFFQIGATEKLESFVEEKGGFCSDTLYCLE